MRKPHKLRKGQANEFPRHIITFDVESRLEDNLSDDKLEGIIKHIPYLVRANLIDFKRNTKKEFGFFDVVDFWHWVVSIIKPKQKFYIFAHNIVYDFISSRGFKMLYDNGFKIKNFYEAGRTFILSLTKSDKEGNIISSIEVLNTGNFYEGSVKALGDAFNLPKLDFDVKNQEVDMRRAIKYCQRDVDIISVAMQAWFNFCIENDLGNMGKTVPGQAFNAFRHRFLKDEIFIHNSDLALELERKSYYGGRVECFRIGEWQGDFYYLDVNSMYPYVMSKNNFPVRLINYRNKSAPLVLEKLIRGGNLVIARIKVKTDTPAFPFRYRKLVFPIGSYITYLATPEIKFALENDLIEEVFEVAIYEGKPIFQEYVNFFYNERLKAKEEGNRVNDLLLKLMLNSLYGKFGQLSGGWKEVGATDAEGSGYMEIFDADANCFRSRRFLYGVMFEKQPEEESFNSFPAIASHVTSYARTLLFSYIQQAGIENCFYCDTDSILTNEQGYKNLLGVINNKELGKLKLEESTDKLTVICPKDYDFHKPKMKKTKGVRDDGEDNYYLGDNTWRQVIWPKIGTLIRHNSLENYFNIVRTKKLKRIYDKGYHIGDKVFPLRFENGIIDLSVRCQNQEMLKEVWL